MSRKIYPFLVFFLIFIIAIGIYWPGLTGGLLLDDSPQLLPIMHAVNPHNWEKEFAQFIFSNSGTLSRPVSMISFVINAALFGDNIWYWKLTNAVIHGLCALAIFFCSHLLLSLHQRFSSREIFIISFFTSFIWLLHPLHVSTVLYLVQRMTILATFFTFIALSCFLSAITKYSQHKKGAVYLVLSLVFSLFATLSKETGVLFPIYILLIHYHLKYKLENYNSLIFPKIKIYINSIYLILFLGIISFIFLFDHFTVGYSFREFTLTERLLTQGRVIILYLNQLIIPLPSSMGFFHDDFIISKNIITPYSTLFSIILLVTLILCLVIKFKQLGIFSLGLLFFFASHLLESTVLPLEMVFEHRNYIGSWGIILCIVYLLFSYTSKAVYSLIGIAIILSSHTIYRANIWGSPNKQFPYMMKIHPNSLRLKIIFAETYFKAGHYDKADSYLADEPGLGVNLQRLDIQCIKSKKIENYQFLQIVKENHKIGTYEMEGILSLANRGLDRDCDIDKQAFVIFLQSIMQFLIVNKVAEQKILLYKAHYHYALKQLDLALVTIEDSYAKDPSNPIPLFLKIDWLIEAKRYRSARLLFIKAKKIADNSWYDYEEFVTSASSALAQHNDPEK